MCPFISPKCGWDFCCSLYACLCFICFSEPVLRWYIILLIYYHNQTLKSDHCRDIQYSIVLVCEWRPLSVNTSLRHSFTYVRSLPLNKLCPWLCSSIWSVPCFDSKSHGLSWVQTPENKLDFKPPPSFRSSLNLCCHGWIRLHVIPAVIIPAISCARWRFCTGAKCTSPNPL